MTHSPLDQFIIDVNAIDAKAYSRTPLTEITKHAAQAWEVMPENDKQSLRGIYRPAFDRVRAAAVEAAADDISTHFAGDAGAPVVSATKAILRDMAADIRKATQ